MRRDAASEGEQLGMSHSDAMAMHHAVCAS